MWTKFVASTLTLSCIFAVLCTAAVVGGEKALATPYPMQHLADALGGEREFEDLILVPFQGTWHQGSNTFVLAHGDSRDSQGFVGGNIVGGDGTVNRYWWRQTGATTGYFYFDTTQGRQGPVYVELRDSNPKMKWQFGSETLELTKV